MSNIGLLRSDDTQMTIYTFTGTVLPDTTRVSSPYVRVDLPRGGDHPSVAVEVRVDDNVVTATCLVTEDELSAVEIATLRNIVRDVASSVCDAAAILHGAWTVVLISGYTAPDGAAYTFSNANPALKSAFERNRVSSDDIVAINLHPEGFFLRLALDDINLGLLEPKFLRGFSYRAIEALRRSVCPPTDGVSNEASWRGFRDALGVSREQIEVLAHHAERHGDYKNAEPMSGADVDAAFEALTLIIGRYVDWFRRTKLGT